MVEAKNPIQMVEAKGRGLHGGLIMTVGGMYST